MTLGELRQLAHLLPPGGSVHLTREALLDALGGSEPEPSQNGKRPTEPETMLDAETVAARLGTSTRWVYDHTEALGGRRLSRRCLRFPETAVRLYIKRLQ